MLNFHSEHNPAFRAPITDVVARFGLRLKRQGRELVGPCPVCGGNDRFAVHPTKGVWNCRHCVRGGDAIALLRHVEGWSFKEAVAALGGVDSASGRRAPTPSAANDDRTLSVAVRIWDRAVALGPEAIAYFEGRGIDIDAVPEQGGLRWLAQCPWESGTKPCVVGRYTTATGAQRGIWRRPIDGTKPKALGPTAECVIRLWPNEAVELGLVIGEGPETVLAASTRIEHRGTLLQPAWAAGSAGNLAQFPILPGIEALTVLVDNDESGAGQFAAEKCSARWQSAGCEVTLLTPTISNTDFNDLVLS